MCTLCWTGSSGAGKRFAWLIDVAVSECIDVVVRRCSSTLLDILANRIKRVTGTLLVNGRPPQNNFNRISGYGTMRRDAVQAVLAHRYPLTCERAHRLSTS